MLANPSKAIKSFQSGSTGNLSAGATTTFDITINAVDVSKCSVSVQDISAAVSRSSVQSSLGAYLVNATTLRITRSSTGATFGASTYNWEVIEYVV